MSGPGRKSLLACMLTLALAGCGGEGAGSEGTLTAEQANTLEENLTQVENNFSAGRCDDAEADADQLIASVDALPAEVGEEVKAPLFEMAKNLEDLTAEQCEASDDEEPTDPDPATTAPTTDPTSSSTTETESTTTDPEEDEDEEEEEPDEESTPPDGGPPEVPPGQQPGGPPNSGGGIGTGDFSEDDKR